MMTGKAEFRVVLMNHSGINVIYYLCSIRENHLKSAIYAPYLQ